MAYFEVSIKHNDETFEALSHMQYDLFCRKNRVARTLICIICAGIGTYNFSQWWGILLTAYGCYLLTSKYSSANHTAHKLADQIKKSGEKFPSSRYAFDDHSLKIFSLDNNKIIDTVDYSQILKMGEDRTYLYLFPNQYGGYMISKESLGSRLDNFRSFLIKKTGKTIWSKKSLFQQMMEKLSNRQS